MTLTIYIVVYSSTMPLSTPSLRKVINPFSVYSLSQGSVRGEAP